MTRPPWNHSWNEPPHITGHESNVAKSRGPGRAPADPRDRTRQRRRDDTQGLRRLGRRGRPPNGRDHGDDRAETNTHASGPAARTRSSPRPFGLARKPHPPAGLRIGGGWGRNLLGGPVAAQHRGRAPLGVAHPAAEQIAALPAHLLLDYAQALDAAAAAPWDGTPHHKDNPAPRCAAGCRPARRGTATVPGARPRARDPEPAVLDPINPTAGSGSTWTPISTSAPYGEDPRPDRQSARSRALGGLASLERTVPVSREDK